MNLEKMHNIANYESGLIEKLDWVYGVQYKVSQKTNEIVYTITPVNEDSFDVVANVDTPMSSETVVREIDARYKPKI